MANNTFIDTLQEFDAGIFEKKLTKALQEVALGTVRFGDKGKKGKLTIELTVARIGGSGMVELAHKISFKKPTAQGDAGENNTTNTAMYVNREGNLSVAPDKQQNMFDDDSITRLNK